VKLYMPLASVVTFVDVMPASTMVAPETGTPVGDVTRPLITSVPVSACELDATVDDSFEVSPVPLQAVVASDIAPPQQMNARIGCEFDILIVNPTFRITSPWKTVRPT